MAFATEIMAQNIKTEKYQNKMQEIMSSCLKYLKSFQSFKDRTLQTCFALERHLEETCQLTPSLYLPLLFQLHMISIPNVDNTNPKLHVCSLSTTLSHQKQIESPKNGFPTDKVFSCVDEFNCLSTAALYFTPPRYHPHTIESNHSLQCYICLRRCY